MISHEDGAYSVRLPAVSREDQQRCRSAHGWCYTMFDSPELGLWVWGRSTDLTTEVFGFAKQEDAMQFQLVWG
jgi:hypothetical protein